MESKLKDKKSPARVTMSDVAKKVGVSRTAVSFVLNDQAREKGISLNLAKKVQEAAAELDYKPAAYNRRQTGRATKVIGLLVPYLQAEYGVPLVGRLESKMRETGYQLILAQHEDSLDSFQAGLEQAKRGHLDGLIVVPPPGADSCDACREELATGPPVVFAERQQDGIRISTVVQNVEQVIRIAVEQLVKLNHRRIALCNAVPDLLETQQREQAFRMALSKHGIEFDPNLHSMTSIAKCINNTSDSADDCSDVKEDVKRWLNMKDPPTAIVAVNSRRAIATYTQICEAGLSVPRDISIIACTGLTFGAFHQIKFSCVSFSYAALADVALEQLIAKIENPELNERLTLLPVEFRAGESTAELRV